jgi:hypothetical protein
MHWFSLSAPPAAEPASDGAGAEASAVPVAVAVAVAVAVVVAVAVGVGVAGLGDSGESSAGRLGVVGVAGFARGSRSCSTSGFVEGVVEAGSGVGSGRELCSSSLPSLQARRASRGRALEKRTKARRDIRRAAYTAWHNLARVQTAGFAVFLARTGVA